MVRRRRLLIVLGCVLVLPVALWCEATIGGADVMLASVHNDSFDAARNLEQTRQILDFAAGRAALLAGDFNAPPDSPSIRIIRESGRFVGAFDGPLTYPARNPRERIDYVFAPAGWELVEARVLPRAVSDHLPIVSIFRVPAGGR